MAPSAASGSAFRITRRSTFWDSRLMVPIALSKRLPTVASTSSLSMIPRPTRSLASRLSTEVWPLRARPQPSTSPSFAASSCNAFRSIPSLPPSFRLKTIFHGSGRTVRPVSFLPKPDPLRSWKAPEHGYA